MKIKQISPNYHSMKFHKEFWSVHWWQPWRVKMVKMYVDGQMVDNGNGRGLTPLNNNFEGLVPKNGYIPESSTVIEKTWNTLEYKTVESTQKCLKIHTFMSWEKKINILWIRCILYKYLILSLKIVCVYES